MFGSSSNSDPALEFKADDLAVEDGHLKCPHCGHKIPLGASLPTAKANMKKHVEKNEKCKAARASSSSSAPKKTVNAFQFLWETSRICHTNGTTYPEAHRQWAFIPLACAAALFTSRASTKISPPSPDREFPSGPFPQINRAARRPRSVADEEHPFARFRNYEGSIADDAEPWEVWDRKMGISSRYPKNSFVPSSCPARMGSRPCTT
ncbi:hypothetical protein B0H14DRAFT_3854177 [Mycena olivaceomarginata]|nr:hypothetical protein B0H14DRAFT_3854177 [Mycena olivaceomarginata]